MLRTNWIYKLAALFLCLSFSVANAEEKKQQGPPPAKVVVSEVGSGMIAPENDFVGTVYYQEVSEVASEVSGKVETVSFEEGQRVNASAALVRLSADLLVKTLDANRASYEQVLAELEKAHIDLKRAENLFKEKLISEQLYDEPRFRAKGLEKKSAALKADVERLEAEVSKKEIVSPYAGIIIKKHVDRGEWLSPGSTVATIAKDDEVDIMVDVPEAVTRHIRQGMPVNVLAANRELKGKVVAVIPRGDISTRTFPVKVRVTNDAALIEGMEAKVTLPTGKKEKTLTISRDAVITAYGNTMVYAVIDAKAAPMPVQVIGYDGMTAGITGEGLEEGMKLVIKGNERLRPGQAVMIQQ